MRPNSLTWSSTTLRITGINHIYKIYPAVSVMVIVRHVRQALLTCQLASFSHHFVGSYVHIIFVSSSIISHILTQCDRTYDIKLRLELSVTLCYEIVASRANRAILIGISHLIHLVVDGFLRESEFLILKLSQNNNTLYNSSIASGISCSATHRSLCFRQFDRLPRLIDFMQFFVALHYTFFVRQNRCIDFADNISTCDKIVLRIYCGITIKSVITQCHRSAIFCCIIVIILIATQANTYPCSIRLCHNISIRIGRYCQCSYPTP